MSGFKIRRPAGMAGRKEKDYQFWTKQQIAIVKKYFTASREIRQHSSELNALWDKMIADLKATGRGTMTLNMVTAIARTQKLGSWGMKPAELLKRDTAAFKKVFEREYASREDLFAALRKTEPINRFMRDDPLVRRMRQCGFRLPKLIIEHVRQPSFNRWIEEIVSVLMNAKRAPEDMDELQCAVLAALPKHLSEEKAAVTKELLYELMYDCCFDADKYKLLEAALKANKTDEQVCESFKALRKKIPRWVIEKRLEDMRGRTHASYEVVKQAPAGILRFDRDVPQNELHDIPDTSFEQPFHALSDDMGEDFDVGVISAPRVGLPYNPDIWNNLLRCGLSTAAKRKQAALVIGGGLFELVLKKVATHNRLLSDIVLAHKEFDPETVAECYRPEVERILESGSIEPIFVTAPEKFAELLRGWFKVATKPNGDPEYNGPVYVVLGPDDIEIIRKMAAADFGFQQKQKHAVAEAEKRYHARLLVLAEKELSEAEASGDQQWINNANTHLYTVKKALDMATDLVNRTYVTNMSETQNALAVRYYTGLFVKKIEEKIPNAIVVGMHDAYMRFGKSQNIAKFACPTSSSSFEDAVKNHGAVQRAGHLPAVTVLMKPNATHYRETSVQNYMDGQMFGEAAIVGAPVLIDADPILERARGSKVPLEVAKAVADAMYSGGMIELSFRKGRRVGTRFLSIELVREVGRSKRPKTPSKMLWIMLKTDMHIGGSMRFRIYRSDGTIMGVTEASLEMMKRSGISRDGTACVHMFTMCDDILNGNHFGTERSPHYNKAPIAGVMWDVHKRQEVSEELRSVKQLREHDNETIRMLCEQLWVRPPDTLTGQLHEFMEAVLNPYGDVFKAILLRAKKSNVVVRGISTYTGKPDTRDVGIHNWGSGNHAGKTANYMWHEGPDIADRFRQRFLNDPDLKGFDLNKLICAPVSQRESFGYGTLCVDGTCMYGLHVSATPPKRMGWYDLMKGWLMVNRQRGNPSTILGKVPIIHLTGDKHFFAVNVAGGDIYVMGPSDTHTDEYAEMAGGLRENNTGVAFVGIPIEGPDSGEFRAVHLTPKEIQEYISHPERKVPWGDICPNPA